MSLRTTISENRIREEFLETSIRGVTYFVNKEDPSQAYMNAGRDGQQRYVVEQIQESALLTLLSSAVN